MAVPTPSSEPDRPWTAVANGGTTNLRVHLLDPIASQVVATSRRSLGVANLPPGAQRHE